MPDLIGLLGIRLQLLIGRQALPAPAPYEVVDALISLSVTNNDRQRDGFQMEFSLGKDSSLEYGLLKSGLLDFPNRVIIMMIFGALPQVLIDGIITDLQIVSSNEPGRSTLHVTGEDLSVLLSFDDQNQTHANQSDSTIVRQLLARAGFRPQVTEASDTPSDRERLTTQPCNNLQFIRNLAQRNSFVFYVEPTDVPGVNLAYWGPEQRQGERQPALVVNMGPNSNVDTPINFHLNALGPAEPEVSIIEPFTKLPLPIPLPSSLLPSLSSDPVKPLRKTKSRDAANLSFAQALLRATTGSIDSSDAIEATGEVDAVRYGRALRARRLVDVAGAGPSYDGTYYVEKVVHNIRRFPRGEYKMNFTLKRGGRGASSRTVTPAVGAS
jgi:hypothetical protein